MLKAYTGSYIRIGDKEYKVCNVGMLANFIHGTEVKVSFRKLKDCIEQEKNCPAIYLYNVEVVVEVLSIKE